MIITGKLTGGKTFQCDCREGTFPLFFHHTEEERDGNGFQPLALHLGIYSKKGCRFAHDVPFTVFEDGKEPQVHYDGIMIPCHFDDRDNENINHLRDFCEAYNKANETVCQ